MMRRKENGAGNMAGGVIRSFMHSSYFSDTQISMDGQAGVPGCISSLDATESLKEAGLLRSWPMLTVCECFVHEFKGQLYVTFQTVLFSTKSAVLA